MLDVRSLTFHRFLLRISPMVILNATSRSITTADPFQLTSQGLSACLTPEPTLGGWAWPNFKLGDARWDKIVALWANSTLGRVAFWWIGSRQQQGRSVLIISGLPKLMTLDPRFLLPTQMDDAAGIFDEFRQIRLLPANEAYRDSTRYAIDRAVIIDLLGLSADILDRLDNLRRQ